MAKIEKKCTNCGVSVFRYPSQCLNNIYCTKACRTSFLKETNTVLFKCVFCGKDKRIRKSNFKKEGNHFCTRVCKDKWQTTGLTGENNPFYNKEHSEETKMKISKSRSGINKGEESPNYNTHDVICTHCGVTTKKIQYLIDRSDNLFCSIGCHGKWKSINIIGNKNPSWNPELTAEERERKRKYPEYYEFTRAVMKRDKYTCDTCNYKGTGLNVHHLNSYDWDREGRTDIDNGITLCKRCHTKFHKEYGYGKNTKEQFIDYKNNLVNL